MIARLHGQTLSEDMAETLALAATSFAIIATIVFWPRKPEPIQYEEREFLNGTVMVPKRDD